MKIVHELRYVFLFLCLVLIVGIELSQLEQYMTVSVTDNTVTDDFCFYMDMVDTVFAEMMCFPVVKDGTEEGYPVSYENTWGAERSYGGTRSHEGCDLMGDQNERGKYKICSMTDGVVKNIGWLEQGGWRIGIESDSGVYYYYAHLDSYEKAFEKGERVVAGQILGRMGDSGYGKEPGTKGNFAVHLHVGIYVRDLSGKERAINPYWYLKRLEI